MPFRLIYMTFLLVASACAPAQQQQFADIGDLALTSGGVLEDCRVGYRTYGELNDDRSNVIVIPTWFTGTSESFERANKVGPGLLADTDKYFVVVFDALGNGVSSSPSNTTDFPRISTEDMVTSQYYVLTVHLGIDHVHAVMGISMGGMQTFSWLAKYPGFMDKAVPIDGSPRLTTFDLIQWRTHKDILQNMQKNGRNEAEMHFVTSRLSLLTLYTPDYFVENVPTEEFPDFIESSDSNPAMYSIDDYIAQLEAMIDHDVLRSDGSLVSEIEADVMIVGVPSDHMVNQTPSRKFADDHRLTLFAVDSNCGHLGSSCEETAVSVRVNEFLAN